MADLFDGIVMAEHRFHGQGYQEGLAEGSHAGMAEGRRYGALRGARTGSEIGCYLGFALTWQCLLQKCTDEKNRKKIRALDSLIGMIQKFPYEDPTYDKLQEDLEKIRGKFKQALQQETFLWGEDGMTEDVRKQRRRMKIPAQNMEFAPGFPIVLQTGRGKGANCTKSNPSLTHQFKWWVR
ncbi:protein LTO1 homolog isoform X1 [Pyrgilauda ruficollis]|uniref:protein LTO1 homolog isoform X1 n=1 Tax=Pyrgilauda ruficollis TaxID=221976 RepID=UPI001B87A159|nr:protein LTO1 homolog isoform X1 [Pyrgilauda ruficollis]